jgi:hypothetical protein
LGKTKQKKVWKDQGEAVQIIRTQKEQKNPKWHGKENEKFPTSIETEIKPSDKLSGAEKKQPEGSDIK